MHAMTIISPVDYTPCSHLYAQRSRSTCTSDINCGPELSQCSPALTFSSFMPLPALVKSSQYPQLECSAECMCMHVMTIT